MTSPSLTPILSVCLSFTASFPWGILSSFLWTSLSRLWRSLRTILDFLMCCLIWREILSPIVWCCCCQKTVQSERELERDLLQRHFPVCLLGCRDSRCCCARCRMNSFNRVIFEVSLGSQVFLQLHFMSSRMVLFSFPCLLEQEEKKKDEIHRSVVPKREFQSRDRENTIFTRNERDSMTRSM